MESDNQTMLIQEAGEMSLKRYYKKRTPFASAIVGAGLFTLALVTLTVSVQVGAQYLIQQLSSDSEENHRYLLDKDDESKDNLTNETNITLMPGGILDVCTKKCPAYGGPLSIVGQLAGNCDCNIWIDGDTDEWICLEHDPLALTCCASMDKGFGVALYFGIVLYCFLGLAIICDNYFCESLEKISAALSLSDDVAGATFMAAGSSAPELFTAIVTILITGGSEGVGTIVGSAIFNIMVIVAITAIFGCTDGPLKIWWYPLTRDTVVYVISILLLALVFMDYKVVLWEGLVLIGCYGAYIVLMVKNDSIAARVKLREEERRKKKHGSQVPDNEIPQHMDGGVNPLFLPNFHAMFGADPERRKQRIAERKRMLSNWSNVQSGIRVHMQVERAAAKFLAKIGRTRTRGGSGVVLDMQNLRTSNASHVAAGDEELQEVALNDVNVDTSAPVHRTDSGISNAAAEEEKNRSMIRKAMDSLSGPFIFLFRITVPDCAAEGWEKWYFVTFVMSIAWIGVLSFVMVDFASRAGCVLRVPGLLMGLVLLAAGTSVPDAISSVTVARSGYGDMAVANVLGSNIFNIFLCLGLPYTIKIIADGNKPILLPTDEPLLPSVLVLLLYTIIFLATIHFNGWKLKKVTGFLLLFFYVLFVGWNLLTGLENPVIDLKKIFN